MTTVSQLIEDVVEEMKELCISDSVNLEYVLGPWRIFKTRYQMKPEL